jgi:hypothetical protein
MAPHAKPTNPARMVNHTKSDTFPCAVRIHRGRTSTASSPQPKLQTASITPQGFQTTTTHVDFTSVGTWTQSNTTQTCPRKVKCSHEKPSRHLCQLFAANADWRRSPVRNKTQHSLPRRGVSADRYRHPIQLADMYATGIRTTILPDTLQRKARRNTARPTT